MKTNKILHWVSTGLLSILILFSAGMYFFKHAEVSQAFQALGYPTYVIYPLAVAKLLGLIAIWSRRIKMLYEWAYAGFFFDFILAAAAHFMVNDGEYLPSLVAMVLLLTSYLSGKRI